MSLRRICLSVWTLLVVVFSDIGIAAADESRAPPVRIGAASATLARDVTAALNKNDHSKMTILLEEIDSQLTHESTKINDKFFLLQLRSNLLLSLDDVSVGLASQALYDALNLGVGDWFDRHRVREAAITLSLRDDDYSRVETILEEVIETNLGGEVNPTSYATLAAVRLLLGKTDPALNPAKSAAHRSSTPEFHDLHRMTLMIAGRTEDAKVVGSFLTLHFPDYRLATGQINPLDIALAGKVRLKNRSESIERTPPRYPNHCASRHKKVEIVVIEYDLDTAGSLKNIEVVESTDSCFIKNSLKAIKKWKYTDNYPITPFRQKVQTRFRYEPPPGR